MIRVIRHVYFDTGGSIYNHEEREERLARYARTSFVISVCILSAAQRIPWLLPVAMTEHVMGATNAFDRWCTVCMSIAWTMLAMCEASMGLVLLWLAAEYAYVFRTPKYTPAFVFLACVWIYAPWVIILPIYPLIERKYTQTLVRLPAVVILMLASRSHRVWS